MRRMSVTLADLRKSAHRVGTKPTISEGSEYPGNFWVCISFVGPPGLLQAQGRNQADARAHALRVLNSVTPTMLRKKQNRLVELGFSGATWRRIEMKSAELRITPRQLIENSVDLWMRLDDEDEKNARQEAARMRKLRKA